MAKLMSICLFLWKLGQRPSQWDQRDTASATWWKELSHRSPTRKRHQDLKLKTRRKRILLSRKVIKVLLAAHMGTTFFVEGGRIFFMCTGVKNGYRGGDVFGCQSLGEERGKGGERKILT